MQHLLERRGQVLAVQQKSRSDGTKSDDTNALSVQVMSFLNNWLLNHIQGTDRKYGPHLNSKGIY